MVEQAKMPDLIIGIDFGTTGTAVAFSREGKEPEVINDWPGTNEHDKTRSDKVPTVVSYSNNAGRTALHGWGFCADSSSLIDDPTITVYRHLKASFTGTNNDPDESPAGQQQVQGVTPEQAQTHLKDFFTELHKHIRLKLRHKIKPSWGQASICYVFSHPTTWDEHTVALFKSIAESAGFESSSASSIEATLDEAKAVMSHFYSTENRPKPRQSVVVADIGGGTSDIGTFYIHEYRDGIPIFINLQKTQGTNAGSVQIDKGVAVLLRDELRRELSTKPLPNSTDVQRRLQRESDRMITSPAYVTAKSLFGKPSETEDTKLLHDLYAESDTAKQAPSGYVTLKSSSFKPFFKTQCELVWGQIEEQLQSQSLDMEGFDHFVLAGGLGSSPYVQQEMRQAMARYLSQSKMSPAIHPASNRDYKTVVSKGLVQYFINHFGHKVGWGYRSVAQYGIVRNKDGEKPVWFHRPGDLVPLRQDKRGRHPWTKNLTVEKSDGHLRIVKQVTTSHTSPQSGDSSQGHPAHLKKKEYKLVELGTLAYGNDIIWKKKRSQSTETANVKVEVETYQDGFRVLLYQNDTSDKYEPEEVNINEAWYGALITDRPRTLPFISLETRNQTKRFLLVAAPIIGIAGAITGVVLNGL